MRIAAQSIFVVFCCVAAFTLSAPQAFAQTADPSYPANVQTSNDFLFPNASANVPENHHTFTQVELIDILSAAMCQLTGIDPTNPSQSCLGIDPTNGKISLATQQQQQQFGTVASVTPVGGAVGFMAQNISSLYIPAVSTGQYTSYLSSQFGIVKTAYAAPKDCNTNPFGYGFCGLNPLLTLWSDIRDLAYALLTILFIAIGIGVMLRFHVDPRTVMTLQNQIPRVIIAIILITFSFAIAGAMIDLMWTVTYAGVNFISQSAPNSKVALCPDQPKPINQVIETRLLDQPISFTNTVFRGDCKGSVDNGLLSLSGKVSDSLGDLVQQLIHDLLLNDGNACHSSWWNVFGDAKCAIQNGALNVLVWITEQLVKLIIVIAILIALFRLWFELIKCYLTFLIFVIMGPIWIVLGLIPGRPLGFEKWLRIIFSNLAVFPLVAFILVFARVIVDAVPSGPSTPSSVFVPPLIGNPSVATFSDLMGFGAIMIAPTLPNLIKERMKAKSQANLGATVAAGVGMAATAFSAPGKRAWESLNRRNPNTGAPEGALAIQKAKMVRSMPVVGRRVIARDIRRQNMHGFVQGQADQETNLRNIRRDIPNRGGGGANPGNANPGAGTGGPRGGGTGGGAAPAGYSMPRPGRIRGTYNALRGRWQPPTGSTPTATTAPTISPTSPFAKSQQQQAQQSGNAPAPQTRQQPGRLKNVVANIVLGRNAKPVTANPTGGSGTTGTPPVRRKILGVVPVGRRPKPPTPPNKNTP